MLDKIEICFLSILFICQSTCWRVRYSDHKRILIAIDHDSKGSMESEHDFDVICATDLKFHFFVNLACLFAVLAMCVKPSIFFTRVYNKNNPTT